MYVLEVFVLGSFWRRLQEVEDAEASRTRLEESGDQFGKGGSLT